MLSHLFFDLDDTLLLTDIENFVPVYFQKLSTSLSHLVPENKLPQQMSVAVEKMNSNEDPGTTLKAVFDRNFYQPLGTTEGACQDVIKTFYAKEFPKLEQKIQKKAEAPELINWCKAQSVTLAIATNPLFPKSATLQRIQWAGLDPDDFVFYSTFDDFHFTKPKLSYYAEALGRIGWPESPVGMVGDDLAYDLEPMETFGNPTFWIDPETPGLNQSNGTLREVKNWITNINSESWQGIPDSLAIFQAILRATPAVLDTWRKQVSVDDFQRKPSHPEWSLNEVFWHLADLEAEFFLPQWEQAFTKPNQPMSIPNTNDWVDVRDYQSKDPEKAFNKFLNSRRAALEIIHNLSEKGFWGETYQHPLFDRIKGSELMKIITRHDRIHLRQCFNLLNFYKNY